MPLQEDLHRFLPWFNGFNISEVDVPPVRDRLILPKAGKNALPVGWAFLFLSLSE